MPASCFFYWRTSRLAAREIDPSKARWWSNTTCSLPTPPLPRRWAAHASRLQLAGLPFGAMPDWVQRTALSDVLGVDLSELSDEALYRNLDRLYPNRKPIEQALAQREKSLFNLDDTNPPWW